MKKGGKKPAGPRVRTVAAPPPLVTLDHTSSLRHGTNGGANGIITASNAEKKVAWGGAAQRDLQGSIVFADGSIMPKPGELPSGKIFSTSNISTSNSSKTSTSSTMNGAQTSGHGGGSRRRQDKEGLKWDSRERVKPRAAQKGPLVPKSSIAAAAAAAAASKTAMPSVMRSSIRSVESSQPQSSTTASVMESTTNVTSRPIATATSKGSSSFPLTSISGQSNSTSGQVGAASLLGSSQSNGGMDNNTGSSVTHHQKSSGGLFGNKGRGSSQNSSWRDGGSSSHSGPQMSSTHRNQAQNVSRRAYPGSAVNNRDRDFNNNSTSGRDRERDREKDLEIAQSLKNDLEKERESHRALKLKLTSLQQANAELIQKVNDQDKELSMLRRQMHSMEAMQRVQAMASPFDPSGTEEVDSPFLKSLYKMSD